ncbi:NADH-quinone oxidoreductase subunit NuoE [Candidatus Legionella polyplacis]|uniref:NADH-quinone oxidoreductase subunit E n=1 Tax=Candidatus Legionella polyplacis TaxID=2005262 RepID=A0ABZ2H1M0_9GAMM
MIKTLNQLVDSNKLKEIDDWILKYPVYGKKSSVTRILMILQEIYGYLNNELIVAVADYLGISYISVYEVAKFYSMFFLSHVGKYVINICTGLPCCLLKADDIVEYIKNKLGISLNETTKDGKFTLKEVSCLAFCINAPIIKINKNLYKNITFDEVDFILKKYL